MDKFKDFSRDFVQFWLNSKTMKWLERTWKWANSYQRFSRAMIFQGCGSPATGSIELHLISSELSSMIIFSFKYYLSHSWSGLSCVLCYWIGKSFLASYVRFPLSPDPLIFGCIFRRCINIGGGQFSERHFNRRLAIKNLVFDNY